MVNTNNQDATNTIVLLLIAAVVIVGLYFLFQYTCSGGTNKWEDAKFEKCFVIPGFGSDPESTKGGGGRSAAMNRDVAPRGYSIPPCDSPEALNSKSMCASLSGCRWDNYAGTFGQCMSESDTATPLDCSKYTTSDTCPIDVCEWDSGNDMCKLPFVKTPCYDIDDDINACLSNGCYYNMYHSPDYIGSDERINNAKHEACVWHEGELTPFECTNLTKEACLTNHRALEDCEWDPDFTDPETGEKGVCFSHGTSFKRCMDDFLRCAGGTLGRVVIGSAKGVVNEAGEEIDDFFGDTGDKVDEWFKDVFDF